MDQAIHLYSILFRRRREGEVLLHDSELKLVEVGLLTSAFIHQVKP